MIPTNVHATMSLVLNFYANSRSNVTWIWLKKFTDFLLRWIVGIVDTDKYPVNTKF